MVKLSILHVKDTKRGVYLTHTRAKRSNLFLMCKNILLGQYGFNYKNNILK